jgi:hypothetical protein
MADWSSYRLEDFLLFSPRTYWRLFELHNAASWPLQLPAILLGAAILACAFRRPRAAPALLALAWLWAGWSFLWQRYATINWAAAYLAPTFAAQAALLLWLALRREAPVAASPRSVPGAVGLGLIVYALALHPLAAPLGGRPLAAAELFALTPDPTAIATLGLVSLLAKGAFAWLLLAVPLLWCGLSFLTLLAMTAPEAWILLSAASLAVMAQTLPTAQYARW